MPARIYQPAKTAMQSGRSKTSWILEFERESPRRIEPLMGYTSSSDMKQQIKITFDTKEQAVAYAEREGIAYTVVASQARKARTVSYADNFKFDRRQSWTH